MMRHVLHGLALALAAAGLAALYLALDLIGIERGTTYAICGTVAVSAAAIVFALATVVGRLDALAAARGADHRVPSPPRDDDASPERPLGPIVAAVAAADLAAPADPAPPRPILTRRLDSPEPLAADPTPRREPARKDPPDAEPPRKPPPAPEPPLQEPPATEPPRQAPPDQEPARNPTPPTETPRAQTVGARAGEDPLDWLERGLADAGASAAAPPRIVGRYQASGVDYVMYSDGSIEADNGGARRRFGSLTELKAFIAEPAEPRG